MANQSIEVLIDDEGNVEIKTTGFAGPACQKATEELERALGRKTSDSPTHEMRQQTTTAAKQRAGR